MTTSIAVLGEYAPTFPPHQSTNADIDQTLFQRYAGIWIAPGSPYRNMDKTLSAIGYTHHQRRSNPDQYGYNVGCLDGVNPFDLGTVPTRDGVNHPADSQVLYLTSQS